MCNSGREHYGIIKNLDKWFRCHFKMKSLGMMHDKDYHNSSPLSISSFGKLFFNNCTPTLKVWFPAAAQ